METNVVRDAYREFEKKLVEWVIHVKKKKQSENGLKDKTGKFQTVFTRSKMLFVIVKVQ
jgi:hypothetical protein